MNLRENVGLKENFAASQRNLAVAMAEQDDLRDRLTALAPEEESSLFGYGGAYIGEDLDQYSENESLNDNYNDLEERTESGDEESATESQWSDEADTASPQEERLLYAQFMKQFQFPADRQPNQFDELQPVHSIDSAKSKLLDIFSHDLPTTRRTLHCPKRTIWCGVGRVHALVFAPTHEYWYASDKWVNKTKMHSYVGHKVDFFINQGSFVYYAGTYKVHSLRNVHPPGSRVTPDVSEAAIHRATGLSLRAKDKVEEFFEDGEITTECFGLQCMGFDWELYEGLCERYMSGGQVSKKRKAGAEDLRSDRVKSHRVY
ncbi:hypothetical protein B0H15DRAFT_440789 [Mycena belliarum]|uniref:Uncharacterized protein n=1 Tax=Mycena belliarum TaxID=1033014 RepID=A0AAD6XRF3_9AGAR|nr:hypothetical protein B0H15DRAFT_440789 [Mycena belliae]